MSDYEESDGFESGSDSSVDPRIKSVNDWRQQSLAMLNTKPGQIGGPERTDLIYKQTILEFEERRQTQIITFDSLHRDQAAYPSPMSFRINLPRVYKNIVRIDIVQIKMMSGIYTLTAAKGNTTLTLYDAANVRISVTIPDGTYTPTALADALTKALALVSTNGYKIKYAMSQARFIITGQCRLPFLSEIMDPVKKVAYTDWGLGWNMGFGGQPQDFPLANTHMTTYVPRVVTDFIYLKLNDTENMNTIDTTDVENLALSQDSTGETAKYFGKLLLNDFGSYAQTFIESPKLFQPILSRLDRITFDWVDKNGAPITGQDGLSCDWHMTLRIVEVKDAPKDSSTLIRNS